MCAALWQAQEGDDERQENLIITHKLHYLSLFIAINIAAVCVSDRTATD